MISHRRITLAIRVGVLCHEGKPHLLLSAKNTVAFLRHVPLLPEHAVLFSQLRDLAFEIGLDGWLLRIAPILLYPAAQCRKADPKIGGHFLTRQPAGQRDAHCLRAKLSGWFRCHDVSPLWQKTKSKERNNSVKGPC